MEKKLNLLFDYQRFEQLPGLTQLIRQTENRYARELSDEDLELVAAAGEVQQECRTQLGNTDKVFK